MPPPPYFFNFWSWTLSFCFDFFRLLVQMIFACSLKISSSLTQPNRSTDHFVVNFEQFFQFFENSVKIQGKRFMTSSERWWRHQKYKGIFLFTIGWSIIVPSFIVIAFIIAEILGGGTLCPPPHGKNGKNSPWEIGLIRILLNGFEILSPNWLKISKTMYIW